MSLSNLMPQSDCIILRDVNEYKEIINSNRDIEEIISRLINTRDDKILIKLDEMRTDRGNVVLERNVVNKGIIGKSLGKLKIMKEQYELLSFLMDLSQKLKDNWAIIKIILYPIVPKIIWSVLDSIK